ncbi:Ig-like domain-containing protein, partial [Methanobrevibacter thaueri]|uniref:Ig-like domain-containing protein n=1 Tax=Methanobrevibacter thaueri TaxID=190975 RepID=UPI001057E36B
MKGKYFIILTLLLLCISINAIAATDTNNTVSEDILNQQADNNQELIDGHLDVELSDFSEDIVSESYNDNTINSENSSYTVIYVGQNITDDGGNGSYENPFSSLKLACDNVVEGDNVTLNIFNGTYYVGSQLNFKSSNLFINGISGNVIIKNELTTNVIQAISLSYPNMANLTVNNVIFDQSGVSGLQVSGKFYPVYVDKAATNVNLVVFNNCSFIGGAYAHLSGSREFNLKFVNSIFNGYGTPNNALFVDNFYNGKSASSNNIRFVSFENCIFKNIKYTWISKGVVDNKNLSMDGIWFGQNTIPSYLTIPGVYNHTDGIKIANVKWEVPVLKYAIFSVSEKYLGNNQYEIIGKLCWNGTNDTVGDSFSPMTVILSSDTGNIVSEAVLENGTFKTVYTSNSPNNKVTVVLDDETIDLNFTNIDITLNAPSIKYGENQNVVVKLLHVVNGTVTVSVNNKTYEILINNTDSIIYVIPDVLPIGTHEITAIFEDVENHIYGSNSTTITVSKIDKYSFEVTQPTDVKVGDTETITITLPNDATGNITVYIGENVFENNVFGNRTNIEISGFVEGNNTVNVVYSGDSKYEGNSTVFIINVEKADIDVNNVTLDVDVSKGTTASSFNIVLPSDATGNLTVSINGKNYTQELVNGSAIVN